jgi:dihydrofolate synthase / folylpolyglutamate synthase
VRQAFDGLMLPGRFESYRVGPEQRLVLVDVAHNPAGAAFLRRLIETRWPGRRFTALLGMLDDKDAEGVARAMQGLVQSWICVPTAGPRGISGATLAARVAPAALDARVMVADDMAQGLASAQAAGVDVVAFGSFSLVEQVRDLLGATGGITAATMERRA